VVISVIDGPQIMEMRQVVRTVPWRRTCRICGKLVLATHPEGRKIFSPQIYSLMEALRGRPDLDPGGRFAHSWTAVQRQHGRYTRAPAARSTPSNHLELRSPADGRTTDDC